jgi:FkbM family methyltransferase
MLKLETEGELPAKYRYERVPIVLERLSDSALRLRFVTDFAAASHQVISVHGLPFITHRSEDDWAVSKEMGNEGAWEPAESAVLFSLATPGATIVDAGANLGYYTLSLARLVGATGQIFAFEPEAGNFLVLSANVLLWKSLGEELGQVSLFHAALSNARQQLKLQLHPRNFGFHQIQANPAANEAFTDIQGVTLDEVLESHFDRSAGALRILKADVQGHELPILLGAERTIATQRPVLCLEFEPYISGAALCHQLLDWLEQHDYRHLRLIYADSRQPRATIGRLAQTRAVKELRADLDRNAIAAYATLLAYPTAAS